jgi:glycosyltransferase involved in cell wall biosynthesis
MTTTTTLETDRSECDATSQPEYERDSSQQRPTKSSMTDVIVCVPVYNCEAFLDEAFASILNQTYRNGIIAIGAFDDGSSDNSFAMLQQLEANVATMQSSQFRMSVARNDARETIHGVAYARNRAVELARALLLDNTSGERRVVVVFLDADDVMLPTRIEQQVHCDWWLPARERRVAVWNALRAHSARLRHRVTPRGTTRSSNRAHCMLKCFARPPLRSRRGQ